MPEPVAKQQATAKDASERKGAACIDGPGNGDVIAVPEPAHVIKKGVEGGFHRRRIEGWTVHRVVSLVDQGMQHPMPNWTDTAASRAISSITAQQRTVGLIVIKRLKFLLTPHADERLGDIPLIPPGYRLVRRPPMRPRRPAPCALDEIEAHDNGKPHQGTRPTKGTGMDERW